MKTKLCLWLEKSSPVIRLTFVLMAACNVAACTSMDAENANFPYNHESFQPEIGSVQTGDLSNIANGSPIN